MSRAPACRRACSSASATVAWSSSSTDHDHWRPAVANTTLQRFMLVSLGVAGAFDEGVHQGSGGPLEQWLEQRTGYPVRELETHLELHAAAQVTQSRERPQPFEHAK